MARALIGNFKGPKGDKGETGPKGIQGEPGPQGEPGVINEESSIYFSTASSRENINYGENCATLFGKIKKYFTDLKTVAFTGNYEDLTNKPEVHVSAGIYFSGANLNTNTTEVYYASVTVPKGCTLRYGDLLISSNNQVFMITAQGSGVVLIRWLFSF